MDSSTLQALRVRYAAGEKVTMLAKQAGVNWQYLWGLLKAGNSQGHQQEHGRTRTRSRRRRNHFSGSEGQQTPRNPVVRESDGVHRITFGSIGEAVIDSLADYAQNEGNRTMISGRMAEHMTGRDRWANNFTKAMLLDVIEHPPKHLLEAVDQMRQSLMDEVCPPASTRRKVRRNQDWGDELTPESVLVRSLTPWERMARENQPKRSVTIGVNLTVNSGQRAEHLLWRGAAATALADILTQRGMNVEIIAFWTIGRMSSQSRMVVAKYVVKAADMPLDIGSAAVALSEIAYARLVALYGLARHLPGVLHEGLGECETLPRQDREGIDYLAESNITSREGAESWLRSAAALQESEALHV